LESLECSWKIGAGRQSLGQESLGFGVIGSFFQDGM
jgi:hypothetical protein